MLNAKYKADSTIRLLFDSHREGAIDRLVNIYKDVVHKTGVSIPHPSLEIKRKCILGNVGKSVFLSLQGYLTQNGYVNLERVEMIMQAVGVAEDNIFKKRKDDDVRS